MNKKRKSLIKGSNEDSLDEQESHCSVKVKKKHSIPSTSTSPASSSPESSASLTVKTDTSDDINQCWDGLQDAGKIKNLLGTTGIVKNTNRMRFQIKTISLKDEV